MTEDEKLRLLAEAGWKPAGDGFVPIKLVKGKPPDVKALGEVLKKCETLGGAVCHHVGTEEERKQAKVAARAAFKEPKP